MAMYMAEEGNQGTYDNVASSSSEYSFLPLRHWLGKFGLTHLESALKDQEFDSLQTLIMLNASDLDELCNEIKDFLKQNNSKLTLKEKATFKQQIIQEQLKYNQYLASSKDVTSNFKDSGFSNLVITKEERQALQLINQTIKTFQTAIDLSQQITDNTKQLHSPILMSISQISKQIELVLGKLFQTSYEKYVNGHNDFRTNWTEALTELMNTKKSCTNSLSMESNEEFDVVKKIDDVVNNACDRTKSFGKDYVAQNFEKEYIPELLSILFSDINCVKIIQQLIAFISSTLRPNAKIGKNLENFFDDFQKTKQQKQDKPDNKKKTDKKENVKSHNVLLLILPHGIDYVDDIENDLKQRNIKIIKNHGHIEADKAKQLLLKQWSSFLDLKYGEDEEKTFDGGDPIEIAIKAQNGEKNVQLWVWWHLNNYFKTVTGEAMIFEIELKYVGKNHFKHPADLISDNFNIWYPSILGEYSATFFPNTINGKFMKLWISKQENKQLNARINLGFTDVIEPQFAKQVLNIEIEKVEQHSGDGQPQDQSPEKMERLPVGKLTLQELKKYTGEHRSRILVSVCGRIFDLTKGRDFYGYPDGPYNCFVGADASYMLGAMSLDKENQNKRDFEQDGDHQITLSDWISRYRAKHPIVGRLEGFDDLCPESWREAGNDDIIDDNINVDNIYSNNFRIITESELSECSKYNSDNKWLSVCGVVFDVKSAEIVYESMYGDFPDAIGNDISAALGTAQFNKEIYNESTSNFKNDKQKLGKLKKYFKLFVESYPIVGLLKDDENKYRLNNLSDIL